MRYITLLAVQNNFTKQNKTTLFCTRKERLIKSEIEDEESEFSLLPKAQQVVKIIEKQASVCNTALAKIAGTISAVQYIRLKQKIRAIAR